MTSLPSRQDDQKVNDHETSSPPDSTSTFPEPTSSGWWYSWEESHSHSEERIASLSAWESDSWRAGLICLASEPESPNPTPKPERS